MLGHQNGNSAAAIAQADAEYRAYEAAVVEENEAIEAIANYLTEGGISQIDAKIKAQEEIVLSLERQSKSLAKTKKKMKKVFSLDAETDGLWGNPFAVAAIVYELRTVEVPAQAVELLAGCTTTEWVETARFIARLSDDVVSDNWVRENVLPALEGVPVTHPEGEYVFEAQQTGCCDINAYEAMIADFAEFYNANKADADVICHMGYIVEAHLLREMHRLGFIGDWDAPYPLLDVSGNLQAAGEDPTSVDNYAKKHGLDVADYGTTHNPLYDCEVAAKAYIHLNQ